MPPPQPSRPARIPWSSGSRLGVATVLFGASLGLFAWDIHDSPFVDEYAYISQSYYADLMLEGDENGRVWLDLPAYDLNPLPKYLIGLALRAGGQGRPGPAAARLWYGDTSSVFGTPSSLTVARAPSVILGALGCVAVFGLGTLVRDARVGLAAAILLALNPLYRLHAHRAMSEVSCEAFMYVAIVISAWVWKRGFGAREALKPRHVIALIGAGIAAGLSVLSKFNGLLALMNLAAWVVLGWSLPNRSRAGKLGFAVGACLAAATAWFVFVELDPFMTARPPEPLPPQARRLADMSAWRRFQFLIEHRRAMSASQQQAFPHNALTSLTERAKVVAAQGFGRFGPLGPRKTDSTRRFDLGQDAGALLWLPTCLAGLAVTLILGLRQYRAGDAPMGWAAATWEVLASSVVTLYLPMAWDRYQLPIQAPCCLLAALFLVAAADAISARFRASRTEIVD